MNNLIWNIIELNLIVIVLTGVFYLVRKRVSFKQQRVLLVGIPFLAVFAILVKGLFVNMSYSIPLIELAPITVGDLTTAVQSDFTDGSATYFTLKNVYLLGVVLVGLIFLVKLFRLVLFFWKNKFVKRGNCRIYEVEGKDSFSFFNRIQIAPGLQPDEAQIVLEHEKMHVEKKHSLDLIIIEVFQIIFWFNPFFVLLKRELINLHEFEVDAKMYEKHKVKYMQFLLDYALGINAPKFLMASQFLNQLSLKKRITIMKTNKRRNPILLLVFPAVLMAFMLVSWTTSQTEIEVTPESQGTAIVEGEIDKFPQYVGGDEAMAKFIGEHVEYPEAAEKNGHTGTAYIGFLVQASGEVSDVYVRASSKHKLLDEEAMRVIKLMPNWIPGESNGKIVTVEFTVPIQFKLVE